MGKIFSFRYALLLGFLLFTISSYGFDKEHIHAHEEHNVSSIQQDQYIADRHIDSIIPDYDMLNDNIDFANDSSLSFNPSLIQNDKALNVLGTSIRLGESTDSILLKLGSPNRIARTEMDFDFYVYNNNYSMLLFIAIKSDKVVGYYTDSLDFSFLDISPGSSLDRVNSSLNADLDMDYILTYPTESYILHIFMDELGTGTVTGIYMLSVDVKRIGYRPEIMEDLERLIYDLTNSIRKRHGIPIMSWSSTAAKAALKHSIDMAENSYFNHYDLYNKSPGDRLKEEGIYYQSIGENIIAGYENAIITSHAWFNSPDHRDNILNKKYTSLGVGFTYLEDSIYKTYITQLFYR